MHEHRQPDLLPEGGLTTGSSRVERGFWREQLRITWHLPAVLAGLFALALLAHSWNWLTSTPPRVVRLTGTHYQVGLQHGRLLAAEIREIFQVYVEGGLVAREGFPLAGLIGSAWRYERYIPAGLRAEMRGIADGSGVAYERILLLNTFADATLGQSPRLCSALAVQTRQGLLVARNLDWEESSFSSRSTVSRRC